MHDVVVVGAGIVGLATAWRLLEEQPGRDVIVLDKEDRVAAHQSSHNSGVVHAGVYYAPGSAKARRCVDGKRQLEAWAADRGVEVRRVGKVVVATDEGELGRLDELHRRAVTNGVPDVRLVDADELRDLEPAVAGLRALHVPGTAITDFGVVASVMAEDVRRSGGAIRLGHAVHGLTETTDAVRVTTSHGDLEARVVVAAAGLQSDRLARATAARATTVSDARVVPFRGCWWRLTGPVAAQVNGNVYPVPDPRLPFLGVHATPRLDGEVWLGPNATLAPGREAYERGEVSARDLRDALGYAGTWRLARRFVRPAVAEWLADHSRSRYADEVRRYLPDVADGDLERGPCGIRAQALLPDGSMVDDFELDVSPRVVAVRNAPSPAATASLAIGAQLRDLVTPRLADDGSR